MTWETAVTVGHWANVALSTAVLILIPVTVRGWGERTAGNRFMWGGLALLSATAGLLTFEAIIDGDTSDGWATAIRSVALTYVLIGLVLKGLGRWREDTEERAGSDRRIRG